MLPGGLGTILEALDITQRKKFNEVKISQPLIFVGSFFRPLTKVFKQIAKEGFIPDSLDDLYQYAKNPKEVVEVLGELRG